MPGAGVKPPAPPVEAATGLPPRRLTPSRVSAKRSWPPGCGRFPAPLPAPASPAAAGPEVNGVDGAFTIVGGRADDEAAPAVISPSAQNGCPDKVEEAVAAATVSPLPENGAPPRIRWKRWLILPPFHLWLRVAACLTKRMIRWTISQLFCLQRAAAPSHMPCLSQGRRGLGRMETVGRTERCNWWAVQSSCHRMVSKGTGWLEVLGSCTTVGASSMQNGGEGDGLLVAAEKGCGGSSDMGQEVAANDFTEIENKTGTGELQGKENGIAGSRTKRWSSESSLNPLPKRRAVSAVRKFPPGCGRTIVTTADSGVLEVSPIRSFAPSFGMSAVNTTGSGDREWLPSEATPVNNGDALVAIPVLVLGESAFPTSAIEASNKKVESKKIVDEGHSKAHNRVQVRDDFAGTKQDGDQRNVVSKATQRNVSDEKMNGKFSAHKGEQVAQEMVDHKMKNELESSLQRSNLRTPLSNPIDVKVKRLDSGKMNAGLLGNARSSAGGKMQSKTLSAKKEVSSNMNTKQNKFAHKLKSDDTSKGNLHLSARESKLGTHVAINQIEEPNQIIVQALMAPDNCPWTRGRKSFASASKSLVPRNKLKGKDGSASKSLVRMNKI
ncbi:Histone-lysine N-methyltransferase H3 lysine-9 specific SUVH5, partial [Zea mays]